MLTRLILELLLLAQNAVLSLVALAIAGGRRLGRNPVRSILVFRSGALGDFLMTVPTLSRLRRAHPDARITLLTISTTHPDVAATKSTYTGRRDACPWVPFVVPSLVDEAFILSPERPSRLVASARRMLRNERFDVAVLLNDPGLSFGSVLRRMIFLRLAGVCGPVHGWRMQADLKFLRHTQYKAGRLPRRVEGLLRAIEQLPTVTRRKDGRVDFPIRIDDASISWADDHRRSLGVLGTRLVAIAPGALQPHKRWPIEKYAELIAALLQATDVHILLVGPPADIELGKRLAVLDVARVHNSVGHTSLMQLAAILQHCTALIANDGGAAHLGAALGLPVVAVIPGIEYPDSVEPWNSAHLAVRHSVECSPCYNFMDCPKKHYRCMKELSVEPVIRNALSVLGRTLPSSFVHTDTAQFVRDQPVHRSDSPAPANLRSLSRFDQVPGSTSAHPVV
jgi:heptosyltransferase-2